MAASRGVLGAVLALVPLLAGCASDGTPPATSPSAFETGCAAPCLARNGTVAPPTWQVGDWWNFTSLTGAGSFSHVVTEDLGAAWFLDTDNPGSAFRNAVSDTSYLGPVRKADLAGSQGDGRVEYLKWPLADDASWTTTWDGLRMDLHGRFIADRPRAGPAAPWAYHVEARHGNGTLYASYSYVPTAGWFRNATFHGADGRPEFGFELARHGQDYPGTVTRWKVRPVVDWEGPFTAGQATSWDVEANATDVYAEWRFTCGSGAVAAAFGRSVVPAQDAGHTTQGACPIDEQGAGVVGVPAVVVGASETWGASVSGAPGTTGGFQLRVWVRERVDLAVTRG